VKAFGPKTDQVNKQFRISRGPSEDICVLYRKSSISAIVKRMRLGLAGQTIRYVTRLPRVTVNGGF
jgi:hypothetical protein